NPSIVSSASFENLPPHSFTDCPSTNGFESTKDTKGHEERRRESIRKPRRQKRDWFFLPSFLLSWLPYRFIPFSLRPPSYPFVSFVDSGALLPRVAQSVIHPRLEAVGGDGAGHLALVERLAVEGGQVFRIERPGAAPADHRGGAFEEAQAHLSGDALGDF